MWQIGHHPARPGALLLQPAHLVQFRAGMLGLPTMAGRLRDASRRIASAIALPWPVSISACPSLPATPAGVLRFRTIPPSGPS
jgi:hypothetical protein